MPELRRFALSWRSDLLLAAIVAGWVLVYLSLIARAGDQHWMVLVFALPYAAALGVRRRWPVTRRGRGLRRPGGGMAARPGPGGRMAR